MFHRYYSNFNIYVENIGLKHWANFDEKILDGSNLDKRINGDKKILIENHLKDIVDLG